MSFRELLEGSVNWKDIVDDFDVIDDVIIQPNGLSLRVRGTKSGKFHDKYVDYKSKQAAKGVYDKVSTFVGVTEGKTEGKTEELKYKRKNGKILNIKYKDDTKNEMVYFSFINDEGKKSDEVMVKYGSNTKFGKPANAIEAIEHWISDTSMA